MLAAGCSVVSGAATGPGSCQYVVGFNDVSDATFGDSSLLVQRSWVADRFEDRLTRCNRFSRERADASLRSFCALPALFAVTAATGFTPSDDQYVGAGTFEDANVYHDVCRRIAHVAVGLGNDGLAGGFFLSAGIEPRQFCEPQRQAHRWRSDRVCRPSTANA